MLLGAYLLAGGFGALLRGEDWPEMIGEFERSPGLVLLMGAIAFSVGSLIVSFHNAWHSLPAILVSAAGWMAVAEGLAIIAVPELWLRMARPMMRRSRIWGAAMLVAGAYLLSHGLMNGPFGANL